jgi:hypothetical protein
VPYDAAGRIEQIGQIKFVILPEFRIIDKFYEFGFLLKTSPGGNIPSSSRNLPVLPPLSTMETIEFVSISFKSLKPDRSAYWPLPPPMVVIFIFGMELPKIGFAEKRGLSQIDDRPHLGNFETNSGLNHFDRLDTG